MTDQELWKDVKAKEDFRNMMASRRRSRDWKDLADLDRRQLYCRLRDARADLAHNGRGSFAGREAKKEIEACIKELRMRGMYVPQSERIVTIWGTVATEEG